MSDRLTGSDALPHADQPLRLMIEHAPAAVAMFDRDMRYIAASRQFRTDHGLAPDFPLVGKSHYEVFPDLPDAWRAAHRDALKGARLSGDLDPFLRADGKLDWVKWVLIPWYERDGSVGGLVLLAEIVTSHVETLHALEKSEAQLASIVENAGEGILVTDQDGLVQSLNAAALDIFGYAQGELLGENVGRLIPDEFRSAHVRRLRKFSASGTRLARTRYNLRGLRKDSTTFPVELSVTRAVTSGGRLLIGIVRDVTARQQAEEAVLRRNAQLGLLSRTSQRLLTDGGDEDSLLMEVFGDIGRMLGAGSFFYYRPVGPRVLGLALPLGLGEAAHARYGTIRFGEHLSGRVAESRRSLILDDLETSDEPGAEDLLSAGGASYAGFPLMAHDTLHGVISFVSRKKKRFRDGEIATIQSICDQIAITLERRRLDEELRAGAQRLTRVLSAQREISSSVLDYQHFRKHVAEVTARLVGADGACLEIVDGDELVYDATCGVATPFVGHRVRLSGSLSGLALARRTILSSEDTEADPRVDRSASRRVGLRSMIVVPLRYGEQSYGVLKVLSERPAAFTRQDEITLELMMEFLGATIARARSEAQLQAAHSTFRNLVQRSPFGVYAVDADFRVVQVSNGARKVFENVRPLIGRDLSEVLRIIWPEPFATDAIGYFRNTLETGTPYHAPSSIERRADVDTTEEYDWKLERVTMPDGRPGVVCHFYDLSERLAHSQQVQMLMREMNHRSKNMLALVDAIAQQTVTGDRGAFLKHFGERIRALAACQDLLVQTEWTAADLASLIRNQLKPFGNLVGSRVTLDGPTVAVAPERVQTFGMTLHELATNAAKYGALSASAGRIEITWRIDRSASGPRLTITWRESNGPRVAPPTRTGFGQRVIKRMMEMALSGEVSLDYAEAGFCWTMSCPLAALSGEKDGGNAARETPFQASGHRLGSEVLIVEDDQLLAHDLAEAVEQAGHPVLGPAATVARALDLLRDQPAACAILDINLGGETSSPIARKLIDEGVPFVAVTAYSKKQAPDIFRDVQFFSKPVDMGALLRAVEQMMDSARRQDA